MNRKYNYTQPEGIESYLVPLLQEKVSGILKEAAINNKSVKVLDVGCGNQPFRELIEDCGFSYKSLDLDQNDLSNIDFIKDLNQEFVIEETFDFILCTEVLEHVFKWDTAFRNFNGLLVRGGKLLITVPFFYPLHEQPNDFWRPTSFALEMALKRSGFIVINKYCVGDAWDILGTIAYNVYLKNRNRGIKARVLFRIIFFLQKILRNKVTVEKIRNILIMESDLYMSNVVVAEKE